MVTRKAFPKIRTKSCYVALPFIASPVLGAVKFVDSRPLQRAIPQEITRYLGVELSGLWTLYVNSFKRNVRHDGVPESTWDAHSTCEAGRFFGDLGRKNCWSTYIAIYQGVDLYRDSTWNLVRVILFCRIILYCMMWPLVFSLLTSTFVSWGCTSVPICLPYMLP